MSPGFLIKVKHPLWVIPGAEDGMDMRAMFKNSLGIRKSLIPPSVKPGGNHDHSPECVAFKASCSFGQYNQIINAPQKAQKFLDFR